MQFAVVPAMRAPVFLMHVVLSSSVGALAAVADPAVRNLPQTRNSFCSLPNNEHPMECPDDKVSLLVLDAVLSKRSTPNIGVKVQLSGKQHVVEGHGAHTLRDEPSQASMDDFVNDPLKFLDLSRTINTDLFPLVQSSGNQNLKLIKIPGHVRLGLLPDTLEIFVTIGDSFQHFLKWNAPGDKGDILSVNPLNLFKKVATNEEPSFKGARKAYYLPYRPMFTVMEDAAALDPNSDGIPKVENIPVQRWQYVVDALPHIDIPKCFDQEDGIGKAQRLLFTASLGGCRILVQHLDQHNFRVYHDPFSHIHGQAGENYFNIPFIAKVDMSDYGANINSRSGLFEAMVFMYFDRGMRQWRLCWQPQWGLTGDMLNPLAEKKKWARGIGECKNVGDACA